MDDGMAVEGLYVGQNSMQIRGVSGSILDAIQRTKRDNRSVLDEAHGAEGLRIRKVLGLF